MSDHNLDNSCNLLPSFQCLFLSRGNLNLTDPLKSIIVPQNGHSFLLTVSGNHESFQVVSHLPHTLAVSSPFRTNSIPFIYTTPLYFLRSSLYNFNSFSRCSYSFCLLLFILRKREIALLCKRRITS